MDRESGQYCTLLGPQRSKYSTVYWSILEYTSVIYWGISEGHIWWIIEFFKGLNAGLTYQYTALSTGPAGTTT